MRVRLVIQHRRGRDTFGVGDVLDIPVAEAMILVQDGVAVPAVDDPAIERRTSVAEAR